MGRGRSATTGVADPPKPHKVGVHVSARGRVHLAGRRPLLAPALNGRAGARDAGRRLRGLPLQVDGVVVRRLGPHGA